MDNTTLSNILDTWNGVLNTDTGDAWNGMLNSGTSDTTRTNIDSITSSKTTWTSPVITTADWSSIIVDPDLERKIEQVRKENEHLRKAVYELEDKLHQLEGIMRTLVDEMENE